jgi:hypothetical protein
MKPTKSSFMAGSDPIKNRIVKPRRFFMAAANFTVDFHSTGA